MATLQAQIDFSLLASLAAAGDFGDAAVPTRMERSFKFKPGAGANQANVIFADKRTINASTSENLDLAGVLIDQLGQVATFTKVRAIAFLADPANVNDVVVGGHATAAFAAPFGASNNTVKVKPGGMLVIVAPDANGYPVVATTSDMLQVANGGAGTAVNYGVVLLGS